MTTNPLGVSINNNIGGATTGAFYQPTTTVGASLVPGAASFGALPSTTTLAPTLSPALSLNPNPAGNYLAPVSPKTTTPQVASSTTTATPVASETTNTQPITQSYDPTLGNSSYTDPTLGSSPSNTPFNINTSGLTSDSLTGGITSNDVLTQRQQMENQYLAQYNQGVQAAQDLKTTQLQDQGLIQNAQYSGDTTDFGQGAAGLAKNAAAIREGVQSIQAQTPMLQAQGTANVLGFQNQDIQNQLATVPNLQNVTQAADGSIIGFLRDPLTGQVTTQNFGNPLTGTFSSDGQTGASIGGGSSMANSNGAGSITLPSNGDGTYQTANGGVVNSTYAQKVSSLSPQYQSYAQAGPQGVAYIDSSRLSELPSGVQYQIQQQAAAAGIPWLDSTQASGLQQVQDLYTTLDATQQLVNTALKSGPAGAITDYARTQLNNIFQTEPLLQGFNSLRTQAGAADTSLMGGIGSGFRQNTANLELSIQNFPTSSDSIETANAKIANIKYLLDTSLQKTFPATQTGSSLVNTGQTQASSGNNYVQTKVGAIPTNW